MKILVEQSIVNNSKRFLNNVANELPEGVEHFSITSFGMQRASGYGSYNYVMEVEVNNQQLTLKRFTHDSVDFDYYSDLEYRSHNFNNWVKSRVLSMLSADSIYDELLELANSDED